VASSDASSLISVRGATKSYGSVKALDRVDASIADGEIHAVLGENGAGKSTLMGVLAGFVVPEEGEILLGGEPLPLGSPSKIRSLGVALVHQHFMLVPQFSALDNLALDHLGSLQGLVPRREVRAKAEVLMKQVGWELDLDAPVTRLPVGAQQRLEILKALMSGSRIIILDEPTAVLSPEEVLDLVRVLKALQTQGKTIILIAHKLSEVYAMADRVTVLRKGRLVAAASLEGLPEQTLADWMVGEIPKAISYPASEGRGPLLLKAEGLVVKGDRGEESVRGVDLELHAGEILGIGGVDGNGQLELAEALAGLRSSSSGEVESKETPAYIPQDRQVDGLALDMPIWENMLMSGLDRPELQSPPLISRRKAVEWAKSLIEKYSIKASSPLQTARSLSGGNQQKVVVSRTLSAQPNIIIAVNPTRGLDIRASQFVHEQLTAAAARGAGVLLFSTDLDELSLLSRRTYLMSSGRLRVGGAAAYLGGR
jgi:general nucleoside transport system ATP-binding protein